MVDLTIFERYRELIHDWDAFKDSLERPLPACAWTNTLRTTPAELAELLERVGLSPTPLSWCADAFRFGAEDVDLGTLLPYLSGLMHLQEEVSLIPSWLIGAQPGERVLDTCAAPGGKSAHMAVRMQNRGTLVANDRSFGRLRALRNVIDRLGLLNVTMLSYDASQLPRGVGRFDRVLADVPCSCEGTSRKNWKVLQKCKTFDYVSMGRLQRAILARGLQQLLPGGTLVYSTCTYAPEENEMVLQHVLDDFGWERVELVPLSLEGFYADPGLSHWQGHTFHESMRHCMRVWPHLNDTGGFFVAMLRRLPEQEHERRTVSEYVEREPFDFSAHMASLSERFGFPQDVFSGHTVFEQNSKLIALVADPHRAPRYPEPLASGMPLLRTNMLHPKLTTGAIQSFGHLATRHTVELTPTQLSEFFSRQNVFPQPAQLTTCDSTGYVVLTHQGVVLGQGLYRTQTDEFPARIESLYPKSQSNRPDRCALGSRPDDGLV